MSFVLEVRITGLCYLVATRDDRALWVIMPVADGHHDGHGSQVPKHIPALRYDKGSEQPSGSPTHKEVWKELTALTRCLQGGAHGDIRHLLRRLNGNQSRKHGKHARLSWFEDTLSPADARLIAARAELTGITDLTPWSGVEWEYGTERVELHTAACCIIQDMPDNALTCDVKGGRLKLYPDSGGKLRVDLCHLPVNELNGNADNSKPDKGKQPKHWEPYRTLLGVTDNLRPLRPQDDAGKATITGVNPYACMTVPGCAENDPDC